MLHHVLPELPGCPHNTNLLYIHLLESSWYAITVVTFYQRGIVVFNIITLNPSSNYDTGNCWQLTRSATRAVSGGARLAPK